MDDGTPDSSKVMAASRTLNFLNLDLDFFIDKIKFTPRGMERRQNKKLYQPWTSEQLREFLEAKCGLRRDARIPGRFGQHHDAVFDYWQSLTDNGRVRLDIAHVDAHADISGLFDRSLTKFMPTLLYYPVEMRLAQVLQHRKKYLNLANYVSFAVACRWVERIEFVTHPAWRPGSDPFPYYFKDKTHQSQILELRRGGFSGEVVEESVPYTFTPGVTFSRTGFANAFLCQSPNYTPATADALIPVFHEYIDFT